MTEPEILQTLARLEEEELLIDANPELPLPAAGEADYSLILRDLQNALGGVCAEEPENSLADSQNILEIDVPETTAEAVENDFDFLNETAAFDFSDNKPRSDFQRQIQQDSAAEPFDFELPENPPFFDSIADFSDNQPEPDFTEELNCLPPEDFLLTQQFNRTPETIEDELNLGFPQTEKSFGKDFFFERLEDSFGNFHAERFLSEPEFEENQSSELTTNFDFSTEIVAESCESTQNQTDFNFVRNGEDAEFPEILSDEEQTEEFSIEDFAAQETSAESANQIVSDFEIKSFALKETIEAPKDFEFETEDFSDFLPDAPPAFLSELDEPQFPPFESGETAFEILPEPSFSPQIEETNEARSQFVVFKLDDERFAFPSTSVVEIGYQPQLSGLPFVPAWFSGIANWRGDVIAVLDLRGLWDKPALTPNARRKMLIVRSEKENLIVGLLVDAVGEMRNLTDGEINVAKSFDRANFSNEPFAFCLQGVSRTSENVLHLLDLEKLLTSSKLRRL